MRYATVILLVLQLIMGIVVVAMRYVPDTHAPKPPIVHVPTFYYQEPTPSPSPSPTPSVDWEVTAYTAGFESTGKTPSSKEYMITASGTKVKIGDCACDPSYPFGTIFTVEGVGSFTCTDRGSRIKGNSLDLYIPDLRKARQFGRQYLQILTISKPYVALQSNKNI